MIADVARVVAQCATPDEYRRWLESAAFSVAIPISMVREAAPSPKPTRRSRRPSLQDKVDVERDVIVINGGDAIYGSVAGYEGVVAALVSAIAAAAASLAQARAEKAQDATWQRVWDKGAGRFVFHNQMMDFSQDTRPEDYDGAPYDRDEDTESPSYRAATPPLNDDETAGDGIVPPESVLRAFARRVLRRGNRTSSGGDAYMAIETLLRRRDFAVVVPDATFAEPVNITVAATDTKVTATVNALTQFNLVAVNAAGEIGAHLATVRANFIVEDLEMGSDAGEEADAEKSCVVLTVAAL